MKLLLSGDDAKIRSAMRQKRVTLFSSQGWLVHDLATALALQNVKSSLLQHPLV